MQNVSLSAYSIPRSLLNSDFLVFDVKGLLIDFRENSSAPKHSIMSWLLSHRVCVFFQFLRCKNVYFISLNIFVNVIVTIPNTFSFGKTDRHIFDQGLWSFRFLISLIDFIYALSSSFRNSVHRFLTIHFSKCKSWFKLIRLSTCLFCQSTWKFFIFFLK